MYEPVDEASNLTAVLDRPRRRRVRRLVWGGYGSARAYFCHAPPEVALPQVRAWAQRQSEAPEDNAVLAKYPRVALAMLNERLGRAEAANADWAGVLRGCEGESCKRERWREQVQKVCKP